MKIKTKDLWQSAFVLAKGGELEEVEIDNNGGPSTSGEQSRTTSLRTGKRKEVVFILAGPDVTELSREFQGGQAVCNVSRLRASMIHLKEQMFHKIKN